jgi:hypothetical protein
MNADDIENARRLAIFDAGREAKRRGFGPGKNPHWNGLEREIWNNGWNWEPESYRKVWAWIGVVLVVAILLLAFVQPLP